jgi:hypothetical protein
MEKINEPIAPEKGVVQFKIIRQKNRNPFALHKYTLILDNDSRTVVLESEKHHIYDPNTVIASLGTNFRRTSFAAYEHGLHGPQPTLKVRVNPHFVPAKPSTIHVEFPKHTTTTTSTTSTTTTTTATSVFSVSLPVPDPVPDPVPVPVPAPVTTPVPAPVADLVSKRPEWNKALKCHSLNFNGRAPVNSVRNFQLISSSIPDQSNVILQMGKTSADSYNLDVQYPLSPLQAFQIGIAVLSSS